MDVLRFSNARHVDSYFVGTLLAVLFTDCGTVNGIDFAHALYVYQPDPRNPPAPGESPPCVMVIVSTVNHDDTDDGSHTFMIYQEPPEVVSMADEWADLTAFTNEALKLVGEKFDIKADPVLMPMPRHPGYDGNS